METSQLEVPIRPEYKERGFGIIDDGVSYVITFGGIHFKSFIYLGGDKIKTYGDMKIALNEYNIIYLHGWIAGAKGMS